jgi:hypothetical protein
MLEKNIFFLYFELFWLRLAFKFEESAYKSQIFYYIQSGLSKNAEFYADFKTVGKIEKKFT